MFFLISRSIARADLDISYITSRVIVMSYPSELLESAYKTNHIEDVRVSIYYISCYFNDKECLKSLKYTFLKNAI